MDATQMISDSFLESDDEESEEENGNERGQPMAKLCILKNQHISETELPLFLGDNVLGRDDNTCTLPLQAPSVSKQHATISISAFKRKGCDNEVEIEALVWDLGSMNGTRKGRLKLSPNVRYALSEQDSLVVADIPCKFVSCIADVGDTRASERKQNGVNAETVTEQKARVSSPEDKRNTPLRHSCLSVEQTPVQLQASLVPESDSDSDGERHKALVSNTDSSKSSPSCSTFLSSFNKTISESEDESPITPSSFTKNRSNKHVSFSKEEIDMDVERQQLKEKKALEFLDDSEDEGEREEERAAPAGKTSEDSGKDVPVKLDNNVSLKREDELPVSVPAAITHAIPALNMDSDTDMEGEEEGVTSVSPMALKTNQKADQLVDTVHFHMDSDTDVDEDDGTSDKLPKCVPPSADTKPPHAVSVVQPEGITMDSDTDVDDDDAVSDPATKAKPVSFHSPHTADSVLSTQPKDFHLDSDTDVDDEEEKECGTSTTGSKRDNVSMTSDIKPSVPESASAAPHGSQDAATPTPAVSEPSAVSAVTKPCTTADKEADMGILSDSDTDVEEESPLVIPVVIASLSVPSAKSETPQPVTDADTDKDESRAPPAKGSDFDFDFDMDCDTDVEDEKGGLREVGEGQTPSLCRENTPALLAPPLHSCSTPVSSLERQVEEMETQAFLSPSSGPCRSTASLKPKTLSHESDSNEDEDFIVAETQSFVLQTREGQSNPAEEATQAFGLDSTGGEKGELSAREGSFQLGLSDSSHQQGPVRALAMESTQAFVSVEGGVTVEETQAYATNFDTDSVECDSNLEATQLYEEDKEDVRGSAASKKEGRVDLALEATQAYISEPCCDSEDESDDRKSTASASAETQPLDFPTSSTLAMAETQPVTSFDEEEVFVEGDHVSTVEVNTRSQNETNGGGEHEEAANPQEVPFSKALSVAETQPMCTSDNEENDDDEEEDSVPGPRKRKAKRLHIQDEESQTRTNSEVSAFETQPMETAGDPESDEDDSVPGPRKRKAKRLHIQDEESQTLTNSEVSAVETQPMVTGEKGESDEEDSFPSRRKRNSKPLESQEEETQPIANPEASAVETQPMKTNPRTQSGRGKGRQSEAGTDGANIRSRRGSRRLEEKQEESSEPPTRQTRGKNRALPSTGGRRGKPRPDETEEEEDVEQEKKTRGNKSTKQQSDNKMKEDVREMKRTKKEQEKLKMEKQEKEEQERLQAENAERLRLELERAEEERMKKERKEKEEKERLDCEKAEREEKERKRQEEKERADKAQKEKEEQLAREATKKIEKERLEREKAEILERERLEREEKDKLDKERKEQEEKERLETAKREKEERERQAKEEQERQEKKKQEKEAKEKQTKEQEEKIKKDNKTEAPARSGRAARRTIAVPSATPNSNIPHIDDDDVPARRTRSRSNSSNSVSSERSASSVNTQEVRGRGRGRGAKRSNEPPPAATPRSSNRRRTMAEGPTQQEGGHIPPQGALSRSSSTNSLAEISSCSPVSQRGRGGRQRGRGKKSEADPIPPNFSQSDQSSAPKPVARGRKSRRAEESLNETPDEDNNEKVNSLPVGTTRGRQQASTSVSESAAADEEGPSNQKSAKGEETPVPQRNVRGQKTVKNEPVEAQVAPAASDADQSQRKGQKRELQAKTEEPCSSSKIPKGKDKAQPKKSEEEETNSGAKDETPVQIKRRGRASTAQAKKDSPTESEKIEKIKEEPIVRKVGGRRSAVQKKKKGEQEESESSVDQDTPVEASEPQTPTSTARRKRQSSTDSSPAAKTPRTTSASPAPGARSRASNQIYKVLFTGVVDEAGERVLARLGGGMAKGVADMNCLVTDKVRRTVKFLCAVAKGVPIVNTHWLEKSGKAGSFLSPDSFVVKDPEQEKKFNFCLQESLRTASSQPLLQGYEIYVTKSVKPEPVHMKDIISCSGATFLPKMPSSHKPQTVVISCEEDLSLCGPAFSASLPVVTAEFILTGILQQKLDLQTHSLSAPAASLKTAGGRGRKKT
ncbi:LOW QUALITY PROTEIN: mediator of DNA damage checkpoint protein 1 [Xyrichtys novacula]|uniref:Mediator of DNA damage checkpoint protein 1 n=1 Tax=Xyrichtys novacula TaxID=13765 RepID=A0AAV1FNR3_XYRNO|nr:LOW QUALITY PROTEIN: mediator of DNA damage checkpoint protein 1 [Xyrichtys novacula]